MKLSKKALHGYKNHVSLIDFVKRDFFASLSPSPRLKGGNCIRKMSP